MATFYTDPSITGRGLQQPDLLDTYSRLMQIKSLQDSRRTRDIQTSEALLRLKSLQQQQADEQAMRTASAAGVSHMSVAGLPLAGGAAQSPVIGPPSDTTSFDRQAMLSSLAGSAPHLVPQVQSQFDTQDKADAAHQEALLQLKDKAASLDEKTLKNLKTRTDMMGSLAQSVIMNPASYPSAKAMAEQSGMVKPGQLPPQFTPQLLPQLQAWANQARDVKDVVTEEETKRHNKAMEGKDNEKDKDISDGLAGKSLPDTPANRTKARDAIAARAPTATAALQNVGTIGPAAEVAKRFGMTPEAFDQAAERYWQTGQLPPSGRGGAALAMNKAIQNRTADLHAGQSLAEGSAEYAANKDSLKKLQGNLDSVSAFEKTAKKNLDLFLQQAKKVVDSGSPFINTPLRQIDKNIVGNADMPAYDAARQVAINEIAKVTSSPGLTGVLSDSARKEVEAFIPEKATLKQAYRVAQILTQDMANRHQSYDEQIGIIKARMGGKAPSVESGAAGGKEIHYKIVNGQLVPQ